MSGWGLRAGDGSMVDRTASVGSTSVLRRQNSVGLCELQTSCVKRITSLRPVRTTYGESI